MKSCCHVLKVKNNQPQKQINVQKCANLKSRESNFKRQVGGAINIISSAIALLSLWHHASLLNTYNFRDKCAFNSQAIVREQMIKNVIWKIF